VATGCVLRGGSEEAKRERTRYYRAAELWRSGEIMGDEPNLLENILPTRGRADLIMKKGPDHAVQQVRLRKL
jgi:hypothetical protein